MIALSVNNLSKAYKHYSNKWLRPLEWVYPGKRKFHQLNWIIRDISFDIQAGEAVGLIGKNGAGKSTLLKLITGTTQPTTGAITMNGRVAALLELGIGFHPEFTGRQNIYMAGQLLGYSNEEMANNLEAILAFAEIGDYIDQPVRTYSSGMQIRLAFSVATAIRPDILIVDEALSVGDAYFQHRCIKRIREFKQQGTTILFVSHDAAAIKTLCDRAILIDEGVVAKDSKPDYVLDYYNALIAKREEAARISELQQSTPKNENQVMSVRSGNQKAKINAVELVQDNQVVSVVRMGQPVTVRVKLAVFESLTDLTVGILFKDRLGNDIFGTNTYYLGATKAFENANSQGCAEFQFESFSLGEGHYSLTVALHAEASHLHDNYDWWEQAVIFHVVRVNQPFFSGVCYLPTQCVLHEIG